jgi:hypothetical protein
MRIKLHQAVLDVAPESVPEWLSNGWQLVEEIAQDGVDVNSESIPHGTPQSLEPHATADLQHFETDVEEQACNNLERLERDVETPKKRRVRPKCYCRAYPFPHRPRTGFCRWPDEPIQVHDLPAGVRRPGKPKRADVDRVMKKFGLR